MKPTKCKECPLYNNLGPVPSQGSYDDAKIIYIIDKPSTTDTGNGFPLSDGTGRVFNRILYEAGVSRSDLFITSVVRCACEGPIPARAMQCCRAYLDRDLEKCKADTVVLAGQVAFSQLVGIRSSLHPLYRPKDNIYNRMGCLEQFDGRKWIGTQHPAHYMQMVYVRDECIDHVKKAALVTGRAIPLPVVETHPTDAFITKAIPIIKKVGAFSDDVETHQEEVFEDEEEDYVGDDYQVDMLGISIGHNHAMVLNPSQAGLASDLFTDPQLWRYEWNGMYDQYHVAKLIGWHNLYKDQTQLHPHNKWMDGMLAAHYDKSYKPKKLKPSCVSRYTLLPYYDRSLEKVDRRLYNGLDVIATHQACDTLRKRARDWGWEECFFNIGMEILPILEEQRVNGLRVDIRKLMFFRKFMEARIQKGIELASKLTAPFGLSPTNPYDLKKLFYEIWNLPKQYKTDPKTHKKAVSTDNEARKRLTAFIDDPTHPERATQYKAARILLNLVDYINGESTKVKFLDRVSPDSRIHFFSKAHGERPFRLSSKPNVQNFPVYDISDWGGARKANKGAADPLGFEKREYGSLRSLIIADDDEDLLLTCDFAQVQLWIYAVLSGSKWLYKVFESQDYIYGIVYEELYKEPFFKEGGRTKQFIRPDVPEQRIRRAKAVPLGFLFGRTAQAVALEYGWSLEEGNKLRNWWFDNNPELLDSYADTEFQMKQKGYIRQPWGNLMWFPEQRKPEAINSRAQCPEAFLMMESMILINKELKRRSYLKDRIIVTVHDALTINIHKARSKPERLVEIYEDIVAPILNRPVPQLKDFCFRHDAEVSIPWEGHSRWDWNKQKYPKWKKETFGERDDRKADSYSLAPTGEQTALSNK